MSNVITLAEFQHRKETQQRERFARTAQKILDRELSEAEKLTLNTKLDHWLNKGNGRKDDTYHPDDAA